MAVYDRSYARWDGDKTRPVRAAPVIAAAGIRKGTAIIFRRKLIAVGLTIAAFGPFVAALLFMYFRYYLLVNIVDYPQFEEFVTSDEVRTMTTVNPELLFFYLGRMQWIFVFLACLMVGAGLISEDRRANALELYLSRPVTVAQYVLGKFMTIAFFIGLVTVVPAVLLVLAQVSLSWSEPGEFGRLLELLPRTLAAGAAYILVPSLVVLGASSLALKARNAAVGFVAFLLLLEGPVSNILREVFHNDHFWLLSFRHNLGQVVAALLGYGEYALETVPVWQSAAVLAGWSGLCLFLLLRRVRPVEIVG